LRHNLKHHACISLTYPFRPLFSLVNFTFTYQKQTEHDICTICNLPYTKNPAKPHPTRRGIKTEKLGGTRVRLSKLLLTSHYLSKAAAGISAGYMLVASPGYSLAPMISALGDTAAHLEPEAVISVVIQPATVDTDNVSKLSHHRTARMYVTGRSRAPRIAGGEASAPSVRGGSWATAGTRTVGV
jgi:hypothetical protein